jgi:heme/copper-type cytochrome/quinol oxidase subunit 2
MEIRQPFSRPVAAPGPGRVRPGCHVARPATSPCSSKDLIIISTVLMLLIIVPVLFLTAVFRLAVSRLQHQRQV